MSSQQGKTRNWKSALVFALCAGALAFAPVPLPAAGYQNAEALSKRLKELAQSHPDLMRVKSVARSLGKREVWLVELGKGSEKDRHARPAMLVVAGVEGNDLAGSAAAVTWIERLLDQSDKSEAIRKLLATTTIYVFPRLNPDAAESFFAKPLVETSVNGRPVDDDHDGMKDEDGPEDLDKDGKIASMRVKDPEGEYILDPAEPRLLIRADATKGEAGQWKLFSEGIDNDHDEQWNEDGPGGVNFNRNFPYQYEWFAPTSGVHQVSEAETRALADFVVAHPNIGIVFTFGAADNLVSAGRSEGRGPDTSGSGTRGAEASGSGTRGGGGRGGGSRGPQGRGSETRAPEGRGPSAPAPSTPVPSAPAPSAPAPSTPGTAMSDRDAPYLRQLGELYRKTLGLTRELQGNSERGTFSDWVYFHRGRLSLAAQAWSPALQLELSKAKPKAEEKPAKESADEGGDGTSPKRRFSSAPSKARDERPAEAAGRSEQERAFLKWLDENAPDEFVAWHRFDHPDFPKQTVEIGGFAPFAKTAPPKAFLDGLTAKHADFLTTLTLKLPRIAIRKLTSKPLGESVYEVELQVENTGYLPTALAQGETTNEVYATRVTLDLDPKAFLAGSKITRLSAIPGSGGMREIRYTLHVPDRKPIKVSVVSMLGGAAEATLQLEGAK